LNTTGNFTCQRLDQIKMHPRRYLWNSKHVINWRYNRRETYFCFALCSFWFCLLWFL